MGHNELTKWPRTLLCARWVSMYCRKAVRGSMTFTHLHLTPTAQYIQPHNVAKRMLPWLSMKVTEVVVGHCQCREGGAKHAR